MENVVVNLSWRSMSSVPCLQAPVHLLEKESRAMCQVLPTAVSGSIKALIIPTSVKMNCLLCSLASLQRRHYWTKPHWMLNFLLHAIRDKSYWEKRIALCWKQKIKHKLQQNNAKIWAISSYRDDDSNNNKNIWSWTLAHRVQALSRKHSGELNFQLLALQLKPLRYLSLLQFML